MQPLWQILYDNGADVFLAGHDHHYERFAPQRPDGTPDPERGIREFVVGTGGRSITPFRTILPNSEVQDTTSFGVLALRLGTGGYQWKFMATPGMPLADSGTGTCH
jgi:acid phosphatase type 7